MFFLKGSLKKWEPFLTFVCQSVIAHYLHIQCRTQPQMWSIEGLVQGYNFHYVFLYPDCDCIYFVKLSPSDGGRSTRFSSEVDNIFHPSSTIKSRRGSFSEKISDVIYKLVINLSRATSIFVLFFILKIEPEFDLICQQNNCTRATFVFFVSKSNQFLDELFVYF